MTDDDFWDDIAGSGHPFVKFDNIGDSVAGVIVARRKHTFDAEKGPVPLIDIRTGPDEVVTLSVDKVNLKWQLAELRPQVGDKVKVTFTGTEKKGAGTAKVFDVRHKPGEPPPPPEYPDGEEPF